MSWLSEYRIMRRARFTRAERRMLRVSRDTPGDKLTRRQMDLLFRYDSARGPS